MHRTVAAHLASALAASLFVLSSVAVNAQTTRNVPTSAYPTIQSAIDVSASGPVVNGAVTTGDVVLVAPGTYSENIDFKGKAILVKASSNDPTQTTLDGGGTSTALPTVRFVTGETHASVLQGFTIQHGGASTAGGSANGGIFLFNSSPTILNNTITANACFGIHSENGAPLIQGNTITATTFPPGAACSSLGAGGSAVFLHNGPTSSGPVIPTILDNTIVNNVQSGPDLTNGTAAGGGAGILDAGASGTLIQNNFIQNNTTTGIGGGIWVVYTNGVYIAGNLITGNQAGQAGGVAFFTPIVSSGPPNSVIANNTIANNIATVTVAGAPNATQLLLANGLAQLIVGNNILSGSSSVTPSFFCDGDQPTPPAIENNLIFNAQGTATDGLPNCIYQTGGTNPFANISVAPQFADAAGGDFHIITNPQTVDAGNNSVETDLLPEFALAFPATPGRVFPDLDGNARTVDVTGKTYPVIDMGAYENAGSFDAVVNTLYLTAASYEIPGGTPAMLTAAPATSSQTPPSGTITFTQTGPANDAQPEPITSTASGQSATFTTQPLAPGLYTFVATYPGPAGSAPATSVHAYILVDPYATNLTLVSSTGNNPSLVGQPVALTATLTSATGGTPPGDLTLLIDGSFVATLTADPAKPGVFTYTTSTLPVGSHTVEVNYAGTALYAPATATLTQVVNGGFVTNTTLAASPSPTAASGQTVTFNVGVTNTTGNGSPVPSGTVNLLDGATILGTQPLAPGVTQSTASFAISTLTPGPHTLTATYVPAASPPAPPFNPSTSAPLTETITRRGSQTALIPNPNPAFALSPVTLTVTVQPGPNTSGTPTGTVTFYDGSAVIASSQSLINGVATLTWSQFTAGPQGTPLTHPLHAVYSGDSTFAASTSLPASEVINPNPTATTLQVMPAATSAFQPVLLSARTSSTFTGVALNTGGPAVTFFSNGAPIGTSPIDSSGNAALTLSPGAGSFAITAAFSGSGIFAPSTSAPQTLTVSPVSSALSLVANPSTVVVRQSTQLIATLSATGAFASALTGTVNFFDGGSALGTAALANGVATLAYAPQAPGAHLILAHFNGNGSLLPADATFTLNVTPQDFRITPADPTVTIKIEHHTTTEVKVDTLGGLVDTIHLACDNLPPFTTCDFRPADIGVNQAGPPSDTTSTSVSLYLDTDFVLGYARLHRPSGPPVHTRGFGPVALALLFPAALFLGLRRRIRLPSLTLAAILSVGLFSASGCSGLYPPHTPPGTYSIQLVGHAAGSNLTRNATLTLVVTQ